MIKTQILEAIKQMPNVERLEVIEFALRLVREGSELTEFVDTSDEDFCDYHDYA
jgi:hypothetical protein